MHTNIPSTKLMCPSLSAIGPYATIFQVWNDGRLPAGDKASVPVWIL